MNTKHTPGPWEFISSISEPEEIPCVIFNGKTQQYVANADLEADARLIAAAPCLLERLQGLMHRLETIREIDRTGMVLDGDIESARVVIDRAVNGLNAQ